MKAKLLRKVRSDWQITEVTSVGKYPSKEDEEAVEKLGLPFYEVKGEYHTSYGFTYSKTFKTKQECFDFLLKKVRKIYSRKIKSEGRSEQKIWYINNQKPHLLRYLVKSGWWETICIGIGITLGLYVITNWL